MHWSGSCAYVSRTPAGTPDMPADQFFATVQKSIANWQDAVGGASYLKLMYPAPAPLEAHLDGINTVKFRTDRWCHPNDAQQNNVCYSASAAGITTVFFVQDGTPTPAPSSTPTSSSTTSTSPSPSCRRRRRRAPGTALADLENTLTHELGHLQGLDHTCKDSATPPQESRRAAATRRPTATGVRCLPIPDQQKIKIATMYNFASPSEISKRIAGARRRRRHRQRLSARVQSRTSVARPTSTTSRPTAAPSAGNARSLAALAMLLAALVALVARRRNS